MIRLIVRQNGAMDSRIGRGSLLLSCALWALLSGCGAGRAAVREPGPALPPLGPKVAIAPMENRSNDLDAQEIIREAFAAEIARNGWNVIPLPESDRMLRERLGISYGGQLPSTTPGEVCLALDVDGVFYGEVREWNKTTTGVYNDVSVAAAFTLYRKDGTRVWEGSDRQFRQHVPSGGGRDIGGQIIGHAVVNLLLNPMTPHGKKVGRNIANKLPGPGALDAGRDGQAAPAGAAPKADMSGEASGTGTDPGGPGGKGGSR